MTNEIIPLKRHHVMDIIATDDTDLPRLDDFTIKAAVYKIGTREERDEFKKALREARGAVRRGNFVNIRDSEEEQDIICQACLDFRCPSSLLHNSPDRSKRQRVLEAVISSLGITLMEADIHLQTPNEHRRTLRLVDEFWEKF